LGWVVLESQWVSHLRLDSIISYNIQEFSTNWIFWRLIYCIYSEYIKRYRTCKDAEEVQRVQREIMAENEKDYEERRQSNQGWIGPHECRILS
jgi:hypothetical protein